jgi:hypothetical protein
MLQGIIHKVTEVRDKGSERQHRNNVTGAAQRLPLHAPPGRQDPMLRRALVPGAYTRSLFSST